MPEQNNLSVPKPGWQDRIYEIMQAAGETVPLVGPIATKCATFLFAPAIGRRRDEFLEDLLTRIQLLEDQRQTRWEDLRENEEFIDIVIAAVRLSETTRDHHKRRALRNAALNVAVGKTPDDLSVSVFMGLIDRYSGDHIRILKHFRQKRTWPRQCYRNSSESRSRHSIILEACPELEGQELLSDMIFKQLEGDGLLFVADFDSLIGEISDQVFGSNPNGLCWARTSATGLQFLRFVQEPTLGGDGLHD